MALMRERQHKPAEAEALYKAALAEEKPESADAESTLQLYARLLKNQGRDEEAQAVEKQAAAARRAVSRAAMEQLQAVRSNVYRVGGDVKPPSLLSKVEQHRVTNTAMAPTAWPTICTSSKGSVSASMRKPWRRSIAGVSGPVRRAGMQCPCPPPSRCISGSCREADIPGSPRPEVPPAA